MSNLFDFTNFVATQNSSTPSNYVHFVSKKALQASTDFTKLSATCQKAITDMKNGFEYYLHVSGTYLVITLYYNKTKSYTYVALNTATMQAVQYDSIKACKQYVNDAIVKANTKTK